MERRRVELAVGEAGEEDARGASHRPHGEFEAREKRRAALFNVVEVDEHCRHALPAVLAEDAPRRRPRVDAVIMLNIALSVAVPCHLR